VGSFFGHTLFNFLDFDWEVYYGVGSTHSPRFGKVDCQLFTLSVFCLRIGQNSKGVVEERGMISRWELVKICYPCVVCKSFLCL